MKGDKVVDPTKKLSNGFLFFVFCWYWNIKNCKVATAYSLSSSADKTSIYFVKI